MSRFLLVLVISFIAAIPAAAQRVGEVRGVGLVTCGEYLEDMRAGRYDQIYTQWLSGFLSGYNIYSRHPQVKVPEEATLRAYLDKYCRENPLRHVVGAATPLITDLGGFKP